MSKHLENLLTEYLQILFPYLENKSVPISLEKELNDLQARIMEALIHSSDKPILISDRKLKDVYDALLTDILKRQDFDSLYERLVNSGKLSEIIGDYHDRLLNLKPFLLFSTLPENVNILLSDAISSYLHSCNRAAVILCGALLEEILTTELEKINPDLVYKSDNGDKPDQLKMPIIIQNAIDSKLMNKKLKKDAKHINTERNDAVHNCKYSSDAITLKIIEKTKKIMENIYEKQ